MRASVRLAAAVTSRRTSSIGQFFIILLAVLLTAAGLAKADSHSENGVPPRPYDKTVRFEAEGLTLVGTLAHPGALKRAPVVIILHGMSGERDGPEIAGSTQGLFERVAEQWSNCGIASLRFSTRGKGGSDGSHEDMSLEGRIRETRAAIGWVSRQPDLNTDAAVILGYSQGAAIAATVAGRLAAGGNIKGLLLWSPNLNPLARYEKFIGMEQLTAGLNAPEGKVVMIAPGLGFKQAFFRDVWSLNPAAEISQFRGPIHIVYGVGDRRTGPEDAEPFLHFHDGPHDMTTIDGNHHLTASAGVDATDELARQQAQWLFSALKIEGPDCPSPDAGGR